MKHILTFIFCIILLLASINTANAKKEILKGPITGDVLSVYDGDTMTVDIQVWLNQRIQTKLRIDGIDTPEMRGKCLAEKVKAKQARAEVLKIVNNNKVEIYDIRYGKYAGRVLAKIRTMDGTDIGEHMIKKGLARPYHGKKRTGWCG